MLRLIADRVTCRWCTMQTDQRNTMRIDSHLGQTLYVGLMTGEYLKLLTVSWTKVTWAGQNCFQEVNAHPIDPTLFAEAWRPINPLMGILKPQSNGQCVIQQHGKVAVLTYKVVHGCAPSYLGPFVRVADLPSRRALRSANTSRLIQPQSNRSTVGDRAFLVAGS